MSSSLRSSGHVEFSLSHGAIQSRSKRWSLWHGSWTTSGYWSVSCCQPRDRWPSRSTLALEKRVHADRARVGWLQTLLGDSLQLVQEAVGHALELGGRVICILPKYLDHIPQQITVSSPDSFAAGLVVRRSSAHHLECIGKQAKRRRHVFRLRQGIGIGVCRVGCIYEFKLGEKGREIWSTRRRLWLVCFDIVFHCC